jgi:hypothetical protein
MTAKNATSAVRKSTRSRSNLRARVVSAFREVAGGVDDQKACDRTRDFYRSSGTEGA